MKLIIAFFTIIALNSNIFAAITSDETTILETLGEHNLHLAYQDFLDYRSTHPEAYDPTLQSPIAFAYELGVERSEEEIALEMLNITDAIDFQHFSSSDISTLHSIIRHTYFNELLPVIESPATKLWLVNIIDRVFPRHEELLAAAKLANSRDLETKRTGALILFSLATNDSTDTVVKRQAAAIAASTRDNKWESFLTDEQQNLLVPIFADAISDISLSPDDILFFSKISLCYLDSEANKDFLVSTLDTLATLMLRADLSSDQKIDCAQKVIERGYIDFSRFKEKRIIAAKVIETLIEENPTKLMHLGIILQAVKDNESAHSLDKHIVTTEQRNKLIANRKRLMREGRSYQKFNVARDFLYLIDSPLEKDTRRDITISAAETLASLLSNSHFTKYEQMLAAWRILDSQYYLDPQFSDIGKYVPVEAKKAAIQRLIELIDVLEIENNDQSIIKILGTKNEDRMLILTSQATLILEESFRILDHPELTNVRKLCLAEKLVSAENLVNEVQFNHIISKITPIANSNAYCAQNISKHPLLSVTQREQILSSFIVGMNDTARSLEERKTDAHFIKSSTHTTLEQKAAADLVLDLTA